MKRWLAILTILLCLRGGLAGTARPGGGSARRPNIIVILTDDQGYGDVGRHGNPILKTPHLDRLHDESVRLTDFHVSSTCAPTRAAILSGRHDFRNGITHTIFERERMSLRTTTIAEVLRGAGYRTGIFGKWHLGDEPAYRPDRRGFEETFIHGCGGIGQSYVGSCGDAPGNSYFNPVILHNGVFEETKGYCTDVFFNRAMGWIREVKGRPFLAFITPNAPHTPLDVPAEYEKLYAGKVPPNTAKFFGMVQNIDDNLGRLLAMLEAEKLDRETLVIFMNDNGGTGGVPVWNAGMRGAKNTPYIGGTRAMSFWRWPGRLTPGERSNLTGHVDVFPTLAELAGVKLRGSLQAQVEGRSLVPLLQSASAAWPERIFVRHIGRWPQGADPRGFKYGPVSVRNQRWQLVNPGRENARQWELYDLAADPGQKSNVAADHPQVVRQLEAAYDRWWDDVQPFLVNERATPPSFNPYHTQYWKQYQGPGPNNIPPGTNLMKSP